MKTTPFLLARCLRGALIFSLACCFYETVSAQEKSERFLPTFDVRVNAPVPVASLRGAKVSALQTTRASQTAAISQALEVFKAAVPGAEAAFSSLTGGIEVLGNGAFLTDAQPGRSGTDIVLDFYASHKALFGLSDADLANLHVIGESVSPSGLRTVRIEQTINGAPVFQSETRVTLDKNGRIVRIVGGFVPEAGASVKADANRVSAVAAFATAMASVKIDVDAAAMSLANANAAGTKMEIVVNDSDVSGNVASQLVYFLVAPGTLVPAWSQVAHTPDNGWYTLVDAGTGALLWRKSIRNDASTHEARFSVYVQADGSTPADSPSPLSPTTVTPGSGTQPPSISRTIVNMLAVQTAASPDGWIADGGTTTQGNNVHAYMDRTGGADANTPDSDAASVLDGAGKPVGNPDAFARNRDFLGSAPRDFSSGFLPPPQAGNPEAGQTSTGAGSNGTLAVDSFRRGSVTQEFYTTNWYHDRMHALGFDQAAGNFQTDNFGGGGLGNDAVLAEAQDSSSTNNANFNTPPDGQAGRMQMFRFTGPTIDRDSNLDSEIVIHELTHGLSNRLIGNAAGLNWDPGAAMGEGWSDFYALSLLNNTNADDPNARYAAGAYATYKFITSLNTDNYLYGIRRFPYSTDNAVNPLTWADVDQTTASDAGGIAPSILGQSNSGALEVHNAGEVWCLSLWEMRARIIADPAGANNSVPTGNQTSLQIVTDAMKLTPINPSFIEARDAVVLADFAASGGANEDSIWGGFADRGLGYGARCPNKYQFGNFSSYLGMVESFDLPYLDVQSVAIDDSIGNNNGALDPNEPARLTVTLKNPWRRTTKGVASATAVLTSSTPGVVITDGSSAYGAIAAQGSTAGDAFQILVPAGATAGQSLNFTITVTSSLGTKAVNFSRRVGTPGGAGAAQTFTHSAVGLAVPDNSATGATDTLNIPADLDIMDVDLRIDSLTHTYPGDLFFCLKGPSGYGCTPIGWLGVNATGGGGDDMTNVTISDGAAGELITLADASAPYTGTYSPLFNSSLWSGLGFGPGDPVGQLSRFNDTSSQGDWKLLISDQGPADIGALNSWSLIITPRTYSVTPFVSTPEVAVEQPSGTDLTDGAGSIDFGSVSVGGSSAAKTFVIRNTGSADLTGIAVTKTTGNTGDFVVNTVGMSTTVAAGNFTTFTVTFSPAASGARNTTLQIASNDADENPFDISIQGTGVLSVAPVPVGYVISGNPADVATGNLAPDASGNSDGTQFDALQRSGYLAENGTLAFLGYLKTGVGGVDLTNYMGYWKHSGATLTRIARQGSDAPETGATAAKFNIMPLIPGINDDGQVTLYASLLQSGLSTPATTSDNDTGLWSELGGTGFQILIRENDDIPGLGGPKVDALGYGCFATTKTSATTGEAAFIVGMKNGSTDTALLRTSVVNSDTTAVGVIARENVAAPGGGGESFNLIHGGYTGAVRMDAAGNVVFAGWLKPSGKLGIWYQDQATKTVSKTVLAGETAPGTTATFQSIDLPNMGGGGTYAFRAVLNADGDNSTNSKNDGIWKGTATAVPTLILRRGDSNTERPGLFTGAIFTANPGIKAGNIYNGWLTNANHGAWLGWVDLGGDGINSYPTDTFGVYTDASGTMTLLTASGQPAPGIAGASFFFIDHPVCGGAEQVAFIATVTGGGVASGTNDKGVWRTAPSGSALSLVLRTGDGMTVNINGVPTSKTIMDIDIPGSNYAEHIWETPVMDATGRLLIFVTFTDGSTTQVIVP